MPSMDSTSVNPISAATPPSPHTGSHHPPTPGSPSHKVAVVGSGISGLSAAWMIQKFSPPHKNIKVTLFEAAPDRCGGHSNTRLLSLSTSLTSTSKSTSTLTSTSTEIIPADTGFIVFNEQTYPNLVELFQHLGVEYENSDMSFAVSVPGVEWASHNIQALLFAHPDNITNPHFYQMLSDMLRFNALIPTILQQAEQELDSAITNNNNKHSSSFDLTIPSNVSIMTLQQFLNHYAFSKAFINLYLLPMVSAVWSASFQQALHFPVVALFRFFLNHGFAQVFNRPQWLTTKNRSAAYVDAILKDFNKHGGVVLHEKVVRANIENKEKDTPIITLSTLVATSTPATTAREIEMVKAENLKSKNENKHSDSQQLNSSFSYPTDHDLSHASIETSDPALQNTYDFDKVVFATHAPTTLNILGNAASSAQKQLLKAFPYAMNEIVVHTDASLMPESKSAWASWNFTIPNNATDTTSTSGSASPKDTIAPIRVTYWLNRLQNFHKDAPDVFETLNGACDIDPSKILFKTCYEHPQFTKESILAQKHISQVQGHNGIYFCGAYTRYGFHEDGLMSGLNVAELITGVQRPWANNHSFISKSKKKSPYLVENLVYKGINYIQATLDVANYLLGTISQKFMHYFLKSSIKLGSFVFKSVQSTTSPTVVYGQSVNFCQKAGLPVSTLVLNRPLEFYARLMTAADIGFSEAYIHGDFDVDSLDDLYNALKIMILNRDTGNLSATSLGILRVVALANNFIHLVFNKNSLIGSRKNIEAHYDLSNDLFALFLGKSWMYSSAIYDEKHDSLDTAQWNKLDHIIRKAKIRSSDHVLEIGFGWGEFAIRVVQTTGCRVTGITLSTEQLLLARERVKAAGLEDRITLMICDYRQIQGIYDRIVSIEMMEALGHEFIPSYFQHLNRLLNKDGVVVVQVITTPENRYQEYKKSSDFINKHIFPGSCCPSFATIVEAMEKNTDFIIEHVENIGPHYARTLREWRDAFLANRDQVLELGFDEAFIRKWTYYFIYCEVGFATRTIGDLQIVFTRPGNVASLGST